PVDDPLHSVGVAGEVVAELGGGIGEVAPSGLAPAAAGRVSPERVEIAVTFKRDGGEALGGGGQQQRSEWSIEDRGGDAGRGERVGGGSGLRDGASSGSETGVIVVAFGADPFGARVDPLDEKTGVADLLGILQPADKIKYAQAQAAAKVRMMSGVRLIPHRLGRAKGGQESQLAELRQRGVDR